MGACLSSGLEEQESQGCCSRAWAFLGVSSTHEQHVKNTNDAHEQSSDIHTRIHATAQPQTRPEMEMVSNLGDRSCAVTECGPKVVNSAVQQGNGLQQLSGAEPVHQVVSSKKRKRSLSVALRRSFNIRRPQTAPERPQVEWRISLRSYGTRSPFPDFSSFAVADDEDEVTSSGAYVNCGGLSSHPLPSPSWPLPQAPAATSMLDWKRGRQDQFNDLGSHPINREPNGTNRFSTEPDTYEQTTGRARSLGRRARAISDPFRYARRIRAATSQNEPQSISDEIRELHVLVEERKRRAREGNDTAATAIAASANQPIDGSGSSTSSSNSTPRGSVGLFRSKSRGHIPAIAPSMKVPVRSQVLSDIGSAFSKPLGRHRSAAGGPPSTPVTQTEVEDLSNVSPLRGAAAAEASPPSECEPPVYYYSAAESNHAHRGGPYHHRRAIGRGHTWHTPSTVTVNTTSDRTSSATFASTNGSDASASHLPTAPMTPPSCRSSVVSGYRAGGKLPTRLFVAGSDDGSTRHG